MGFRRRLALAILAAGIAAVALAAVSGASRGATVPRVHCAQPGQVRLVQFEDGSARLMCGSRLLVRVSVPW